MVLQLKEDADDYLEPSKLRALLGTYSEYISFPVELWASKTEYEQVGKRRAAPGGRAQQQQHAARGGRVCSVCARVRVPRLRRLGAPRLAPRARRGAQVVDEDAEVGEGEPPKMKTVPKESEGWEHLNTAKPLWMRPAAEVSADEYAEFYKTAFRAWDEPVKTAHFSLEGQVEFRALLFVPKTLPWELTQDMFGAADGARGAGRGGGWAGRSGLRGGGVGGPSAPRARALASRALTHALRAHLRTLRAALAAATARRVQAARSSCT